ncbi:DNA ligase D [Pseudomonas sp. MF6784]|uniref:DNA ligase D n=1 Tax=Pseudomonas TaxID=286 RepID=UPI0014741A63|nr:MULTISPECIES: DNA ligase D [Pseudomonas]MBJ2251485.1 DNA ligase D [Pseudomonas sp. MF6784]MBU4627951.1 DNA ligase D [Pseudomonas sp. BF61]MDI3205372.1 DNA ligase D [Pseudomonas shahriarae]NMX34035.1 DNA ligase D [Pseudomonas sp. WS 5413]QYM71302.1 DNA ligase D [Pseudomonas sp. So3.2b]
MPKPLSEYQRKRNFKVTSEPSPSSPARRPASALTFVVQKHAARNLHYDFRLELDGVLKSWAVPKGPSLDPSHKRLAVHVEDHPLSYGAFEGSIPAGQYGAGDVIVWDRGIWQPHDDPHKAYAAGKLKFTLVGEKLAGDWALVRTRLKGSGDKEQWLLIKENDQQARPISDYDIVQAQPTSVLSNARVGQPKTRQPTLPDQMAPQLATLVDRAPAGDWHYEIKFDGYRILARVRDGHVHLFTRNGHDWSDRLPRQVKALAALKLKDCWLDGEVVSLNRDGLPDFQGLQQAFDSGRSQDLVYYLFDAPFLHGQDQRSVALQERRAALKAALAGNQSPLLRFSEAFAADHHDILHSACSLGLEGVIGKRAGSPYSSTRSADWIKLKCRRRQEFVIVGYTRPQGSRSGFGALLLAVHADRALVYAGRVGTGFDQATLQTLYKKMQPLARQSSPLANPVTAAQARGVHWIRPQLVAEVQFAEWTREGLVRQAAFVGLRSDKPQEQIVHEPPLAQSRVSQIRITHPERIIDPTSGTQKAQLARFYEDISEWLLPHLRHRPVALLRAPEGVDGEQFFQKHSERLAIPLITQLDQALDPGHARLMEIHNLAALIGAVQMGAIELHTWGATVDKIDTPDLFVLDLDPDPALPWKSMLEAAQLVLSVLDELGLTAYIKTSGGKGLHLIVPLARRDGWDTVKAFAKAIALFMTQQLPERFTATSGPKNRIGKIFIDYLRNGRGASTVAAYSVRARPGLPVSVPISRDELDSLRSAQQWNVTNLQARLNSLKADPWAGYANRQRLSKKMWQKLGAQPPE